MTDAAVVLMAYGSPDRLADVPAYYADIRGGRPIRPELLADLVERHRRPGGFLRVYRYPRIKPHTHAFGDVVSHHEHKHWRQRGLVVRRRDDIGEENRSALFDHGQAATVDRDAIAKLQAACDCGVVDCDCDCA